MKDLFNARDVLKVGDKDYVFYRLDVLEKAGLTQLKRLPFSIRFVNATIKRSPKPMSRTSPHGLAKAIVLASPSCLPAL
jgi:aconitate hydratase